jgi:hypothetical protein
MQNYKENSIKQNKLVPFSIFFYVYGKNLIDLGFGSYEINRKG